MHSSWDANRRLAQREEKGSARPAGGSSMRCDWAIVLIDCSFTLLLRTGCSVAFPCLSHACGRSGGLCSDALFGHTSQSGYRCSVITCLHR
jgi:hypothetical protein